MANEPTTSASDFVPAHGQAPLPMAARQRLQAVFEHAKRSVEKADFDYANDLFTECYVEDPGNLVYLQHLLGNLARKYEGNKKGARFAALKTKSARSALLKAVGQGEWRAAFQSGCEALKYNPWDTPTLIAMADASRTLEYHECQVYLLRWALDAAPKDVTVNRHAARSLAELGHFDQAIACWQRVKLAKPDDKEAAKAISQLGVEKTIKQGGYGQELRTDTDGSTSHHTMSVASAAARNAPREESSTAEPGDSAERRLLDAISSDPATVANYLDLAEIYAGENRLADAERLLSQALSVGGENLRIREQLEDTQLRRVRQQAEVARRRAEEEGTQVTASLAKRMAAQANQAELEVYAARAAREPGNANLQYEFGLRLKRAGKFREAVQAFQAARADGRRKAQVQIHLGECFQHIRQFRLALQSYEAAIDAHDGMDHVAHKLALYRAGVLASEMKELERAEQHLTALAALDFGYRDVADRLDKLARLRDSV